VAPSAPPDSGEDRVEWGWPTRGRIINGYSESASLKGIDIGGAAGAPILSSAPGKVVYAGSGLRGYGKLVIVKHNKTYLSAYAHLDQITVKEGQTVGKGQELGKMGNTDADQVKLHFEIRSLGKPVDPLRYLPRG
jgi:lipoprotein NlpD